MVYSMEFTVDVVDNSMSPTLYEGDIVSVRSGFEFENNHMIVALINDERSQTTRLVIRKVIKEPGKLTLCPGNEDYPVEVFEGESINNIFVLGIVYKIQRFLDLAGVPSRSHIVTARLARRNRTALETHRGGIMCDPVE